MDAAVNGLGFETLTKTVSPFLRHCTLENVAAPEEFKEEPIKHEDAYIENELRGDNKAEVVNVALNDIKYFPFSLTVTPPATETLAFSFTFKTVARGNLKFVERGGTIEAPVTTPITGA